jgi:predicted MFS family arabinose efflux permease
VARDTAQSRLDRRVLAVLTLLVFATSGTIHFQTPLLGKLAAEFNASPSAIGWIPTLTFGGFFLGTLFLVPLGDRIDKRRLIIVQSIALFVALVVMAFATSLAMAAAASFAIGVFCGLSQHSIPLASELAQPAERGRVVGTVLSGVFTGLLFARVVSGLIAENWSWRWSYAVGASIVGIAAVIAMFMVPSSTTRSRLTYPQLLRSVGRLFIEQPRIRHPSAVQFFTGLCYGGFWATLAAMLLATYGYGPAVAGLIGIPGAAGIVVARYAGRWMDRSGIAPVVTVGVSTIIVAHIVFGFAAWSIAFIVVGVALLDCGLRATLVANQTAVTHAAPDARSRATTIFTAHMWGGNSVGAMIGSYAYAHWGWFAVCAIGVAASLVALSIARVTNPR